jgi:hypothetical protein
VELVKDTCTTGRSEEDVEAREAANKTDTTMVATAAPSRASLWNVLILSPPSTGCLREWPDRRPL